MLIWLMILYKRKKILDGSDTLAKAMKDLIPTTKEALQKPNDPKVKEKMANAIDDVLNASNNLREALETPTQRALTDLGELMKHGQQLVSHAEKGERPEATKVMKNVSDDVEAIGRAMRDFDTINANSLKSLLDPARNLVNDVKKSLEVALADPANKDKQDTLKKKYDKIRRCRF